MSKRVLFAVIGAVWLIGVACGAAFVALAQSHEYRLADTSTIARMVNNEGWEPVRLGDGLVLRRPRMRLGW